MDNAGITTESHPLEPFLPGNARILMLGSFPPKKERWSMDFFYPNFQNDMWRIFGTVFFSDRDHFIAEAGKRRCFDRENIVAFCAEKGIALYDTACRVRRLKDNASDKFLEVVEVTDIAGMLARLPGCGAVVTTGQKATDVLVETFGCPEPPVGGMVEFALPLPCAGADGDAGARTGAGGAGGSYEGGRSLGASAWANVNAGQGRRIRFWRMPSSSRAYPLALDRKAAFYRVMFGCEHLL